MEQSRLPVGDKSQHGQSRGHLNNAGYSDLNFNAAHRGPFSDNDLDAFVLIVKDINRGELGEYTRISRATGIVDLNV
jgi:hypothetical protein